MLIANIHPVCTLAQKDACVVACDWRTRTASAKVGVHLKLALLSGLANALKVIVVTNLYSTCLCSQAE
jgi:hypothetical protein